MSQTQNSRMNRRRSPERTPLNLRRMLRGLLRGVAAIGICALFVGTGWWLNRALTVTNWQINGVPEGMEAAIDRQLDAMRPLDLVHAWPASLRRRLLDSLPDLAEVNISRHLPDSLQINASLRMPVALWRDADGVVQLVDGEGKAYRPLKAGDALDLPLLRVSREDVDRSVALLLRLKQVDESRYAALSEWIDEPDGWRLNFDQGRCWLLPRGPVAAKRIAQVDALMQQARWQDGGWRVDVRAPTRWFIRKSKPGGMV